MKVNRAIEATSSAASDFTKEMQLCVLNKDYAGASVFCRGLSLLCNDFMKMLVMAGMIDIVDSKKDVGGKAEAAVKKVAEILKQNREIFEKGE